MLPRRHVPVVVASDRVKSPVVPPPPAAVPVMERFQLFKVPVSADARSFTRKVQFPAEFCPVKVVGA